MEIEQTDSYTDKFYRHRLHHGVSCDCADCDLDHLCCEHPQFNKYLQENNLKLQEALHTSLPIEQWAPTYTASTVLEARGISAANTPFTATVQDNKLPQFNDKVENWWEMDEKLLFPQPTQFHAPIDFFCPCLLQCTCAMELSIFINRSAHEDMPVPSFPPLVCPLVLGLHSKNPEIISLFLSRLFTKIQPNILPPLIKQDKEGNPLPPEPRDVKEARTVGDYDKEYIAGKMLTLLTLPCRGYASILAYNYPTAQWKKDLREKFGLPQREGEEENFLSLLFNYYDMPSSLLLRNKRLTLISPAHLLKWCGVDVARKLLSTKITVFNAAIDVVDSANRRLDLYSTKRYVDLSDYETKIKLASRHGICYGPAPEGEVKATEEDEEEDEDDEEEEEPPAIPFTPVQHATPAKEKAEGDDDADDDEEEEHAIDPDILDPSGPSLKTAYWRKLAKEVPPILQPLYNVLLYIVADDWNQLAELWEEEQAKVARVHLSILNQLKQGGDLLFTYNSIAKCNTYQLSSVEELKEKLPSAYDDEEDQEVDVHTPLSEEFLDTWGTHVMAHLRAVTLGLATQALTTDTQDEKLPLEAVMEVVFSPLYIADVIFSSTTTMYWKDAIHMNRDYDLSMSQDLTAFTGLNVRGLTSDINEYITIALRYDNVRFFCTLVYMIIEVNGLPARFASKYLDDGDKQDPRRAMAMVCEFVPDLRALLSSSSLLIVALKQQSLQCVTALTQMFPIWCWQQLATWAYTGFSPAEVMRLARTMSESVSPVLSAFDAHTMRKLTPIFGCYLHALLENRFDSELLQDDGEALGIVYGTYDKYVQSRQGFYTRGDGAHGITTEYSEDNIHSQRTLIRDLRYYMETQELPCPFCLAGHSDCGADHGLELTPESIFRFPTGLMDIAVIMGHTSVASSLLLLSMALRSKFSLTETFRLFSKETILEEDLLETKDFGLLTPENARCIHTATSLDEIHTTLHKRYLPYLMTRFLVSPMLISSFQERLNNSVLYVHPFVTATCLDNQDFMHLISTAGFDTLTSTESHHYAVDPLVASIGSPTTVMLRTMFTLIRQRYKRLILVLFTCARSVSANILANDELVFCSAIAHPLPIITHAFVKFPYEMFQVRPQEGSKTLPLSARLLIFAHSNIIDYMLYDVVSAACNGILDAYGIKEELQLVNSYCVTPGVRRAEEPYPGDEERDGEGDDEQEEDDEEETQARKEWYADQRRLLQEENERIEPDATRREKTTPSFALALRTASPWVLYCLLRCVHPGYDAHEAMHHILDHILTNETVYSSSPFVYNDNAAIGSSAQQPNPVVDDVITTRNRDLLNAVATINKMTAAVQLSAKATGDRLGTQWSMLYNRFPVGLTLDPLLINDETPFEQVHPNLAADDNEPIPHINMDILKEIEDEEQSQQNAKLDGDLGDELASGLTPEEEAQRQLLQRERLLSRLKFDRFETREAMPPRRSPYGTAPTNKIDIDAIVDVDQTPLTNFLARGMLSTMPSRTYVDYKDDKGAPVSVATLLKCAMIHCLNAKIYGVPTEKKNQVMTVPMVALAPRCNNVPAFKTIVDTKDKTLFDVFMGYGSVLSPDEQPERTEKMPGHTPQELRDLLDQLTLDDPEWGAHVNQTIDHNTQVLSTSIKAAFDSLQRELEPNNNSSNMTLSDDAFPGLGGGGLF